MKKTNGIKIASAILLAIVLSFVVFQLSCKHNNSSERVIGFPKSFADLAEQVKPAVVNISTTSTVKVPGNPFRQFFGPNEQNPFGGFFHQYFGDVPDRELKQQSLGSGFIVDKDGYIITNNHVVEGAEEIKVKLTDGREFKAKVVGRDTKTDLALIKISSIFRDLPTLPLGDSDKMRVGDWVLAVGNPFGLEHTVTQGIISATGRVIGAGPYDNFLQTDAPINPGNSGGPLINLTGEVIGINTAIIASGQGIGFAIPADAAKGIVAQLKEKGKVMRGWIGVSIQSMTPDLAQSLGLKNANGALVADVVPGGPADSAGIKQGDVIINFDGKAITNTSELSFRVSETGIGKIVPVTVVRNSKELTLKIAIAQMPANPVASMLPVQQNLGMTTDNITPQFRKEYKTRENAGVAVVSVESGSPADNAGIQPGDVIKEVDRAPVRNMKDYERAIARSEKDKPILFLIRREGQTLYVSIRVS